jgi:hypothetical protein
MKTGYIFVFLTLIGFCHGVFAQTPSTEQRRIERLIGLAKVWGAVKYFHPFPAYRDIDWDKALVETIPKVSAANSDVTVLTLPGNLTVGFTGHNVPTIRGMLAGKDEILEAAVKFLQTGNK